MDEVSGICGEEYNEVLEAGIDSLRKSEIALWVDCGLYEPAQQGQTLPQVRVSSLFVQVCRPTVFDHESLRGNYPRIHPQSHSHGGKSDA